MFLAEGSAVRRLIPAPVLVDLPGLVQLHGLEFLSVDQMLVRLASDVLSASS